MISSATTILCIPCTLTEIFSISQSVYVPFTSIVVKIISTQLGLLFFQKNGGQKNKKLNHGMHGIHGVKNQNESKWLALQQPFCVFRAL